jgi:hypothetical protein
VAKNILIFDQTKGHYEASAGPKNIPLNPGDIGSVACFNADSTGPASYAFKFMGDNWSLTENP